MSLIEPSSRSIAAASVPTDESWLETILQEFAEDWERGLGPRAEDYLGRLREGDAEAAIELIYQEFCLAESAGLAPEPADYLSRFPEHEARLSRLLELHGVIEPDQLRAWTEPVALPVEGDEIGPYRLIRELGRGGFARVFLARQTDLADRPVVLKVSTRASGEPHLLARARHPHIVEILRHAEAEGGALHLIGMPFHGGATLADVLREVAGHRRRPRSGRELLEALDRIAAPEFPESGSRGPIRDLFERMSFAQVIVWMTARLAEALDQAHRVGISHGDLKPSNVLLAADGRPMLLDFNLAVDWRDNIEGRSSGGTLAYMAPELLRALASSGSVRTITRDLRQRADLYALGLLLREALSGQAPEPPRSTSESDTTALALERERTGGGRYAAVRGIPRSLRPVVARCLAPDPADRYAEAAQLAADLDRWRSNRPLAFANEPAWPIRLGRWTCQRRRALGAGLLVVVTAGLVGLVALDRLQRSARQRALHKRDQIAGGLVPGVFRFRQAGQWRSDTPDEPANAAALLALYDLAGPAAPAIAGDWDLREDIRALPEADRADLELWLIEQQWRLASSLSSMSDDPGDLRRALASLERVPDWSNLAPFLRLRRSLRDRLGLPRPNRVEPIDPEDARNLYALGLEAETEHVREALGYYQRLLIDRPASFWAHYRAAAAAHRLGNDREVTHHLRRCLDQQPDNPALQSQYGGGLYRLGDLGGSRAAFEQALRLDPDSHEALLGLLLLDLRSGQPRAFDADLARYQRVSGPSGRQAGRGLLLRFRLGLPSIPQGFASRLQAPPPGPTENVEILNLQAARLDREHRNVEALAAYQEVLQLDPDHLPARFRQAVLLRRLGRPEAEAEFAQLIDHPRFEELTRQNPAAFRVYQYLTEHRLQTGQVAEAIAFARRGVVAARDQRASSGLIGESLYALARAHAAMASTNPRSLDLTVQALQAAGRSHPNFLDVWYNRDSLFDPIRDQIHRRLTSRATGNPEVAHRRGPRSSDAPEAPRPDRERER